MKKKNKKVLDKCFVYVVCKGKQEGNMLPNKKIFLRQKWAEKYAKKIGGWIFAGMI